MKLFSTAYIAFLALFAVASAAQPNIVVILADDFGWGSSTPYGAKGLNTPNLDRLAREGRRFTNAYAPSSVCSPSRYGLMTGRYYWRPTAKTGRKVHAGPKHDELFNLKDDPSETRDLSATHADQVAKMKRLFSAARDRGFTRTDAGK